MRKSLSSYPTQWTVGILVTINYDRNLKIEVIQRKNLKISTNNTFGQENFCIKIHQMDSMYTECKSFTAP